MPPSIAEISSLSLHDALPISGRPIGVSLPNSGIFSGGWPPEKIPEFGDRKSTRLNSSHVENSYAVFCLKKKKDQPVFAAEIHQFPRLVGRIDTYHLQIPQFGV